MNIVNLDPLLVVGFIIFIIGFIGTWFTSYRYLTVYLVAGMVYWLVVEAVSFLLQNSFDYSASNAYLSAIGLSMIGVFIWLVITEPKRQRIRAEIKKANYKEHTPYHEAMADRNKNYKLFK